MRFTAALAQAIKDPLLEAVRRNVQQQLDELKGLIATDWIVVGSFTIPNNGIVLVNHRLGRAPRQVLLSPPRVVKGTVVSGNGVIHDVVDGGVDRTQSIALYAFSFGVPVDVTVSVL